MAKKSFTISDDLYRYLLSVSLREPQAFRALREETASDPMARMQIAPEQGQFMAFLVRLTGAVRLIEVGVFTGYSSLWMAHALPEHGRLVACDVSEEWTSIAKRYWKRTGVEDRVDLHLRPALQTLDELLAKGQGASFDLGFIDADKENYQAYYERLLELVRPGGLIIVDNVLWSGQVVDSEQQDSETVAIRAFNERLHADERVDLSMISMADGLTLARKR